jgi:hypothetical protein
MTFVRRRTKIPRYEGETRKEPDRDFRHLIAETMASDQPEFFPAVNKTSCAMTSEHLKSIERGRIRK